MKKMGRLSLAGKGLLCVVLICMLVPAMAAAKAEVVPVEGMKYDVNASLNDNLKALVGKKVYITIASGKTLSGTLKEVGPHLLHLEKLDGKDFFDALIRIEEISAFDARFREYKR